MTVPMLVAREVTDHIRHRRSNPRPPRNFSLFKRALLVLGLLIGLFILGNAYLASQGGILGLTSKALFGSNPFSTSNIVVVPDVPRITSAIRDLDRYGGTQHNYPIQFPYKTQRKCFGINCGHSTRLYDGIGWAEAGTKFKDAKVEQTGSLVFPTKSNLGMAHLKIILPTPEVSKTGVGNASIGDQSGTIFGPGVRVNSVLNTANQMLAQAVAADPTLLTEAKADISKRVQNLVEEILAAVHYRAAVDISFD